MSGTQRNRPANRRNTTISRRTALSSAAAAGAVGLSGISAASAMPRISFPATRLQDGEPKPGGTLRYGLSTDPSNFEPHVSTGGASGNLKLMVYSTLLCYNADNQLVGDLAEEFGWVDDTTFQLKIREGVIFHDGSDLTVDDVVFSLKRIQNPETAATNAPYFDNVTDIVAGDGNTVNLTFSVPFAAFPFILADNESLIVSQSWIESGVDPKTTMMGSGPFTFVERLPGISITLNKNPNYFHSGLPYLDSIVYQPMADDPTRVTALRGSSVDFIDYVPYTQMDIIEEDPNLTFASDSETGFGWLGFVHDWDPVSDVNIRKAFALGMDREKMVQTAFAGHGSPITGGLIPEGMIGHSPDLEGTYAPDYEQAKSLLTDAGMNPLEIDMLSTSTYSVISRPAEAAQAELEQANINTNLQLQEWLTFRQSVADAAFPVHVWGTAISYGDPDFLWQMLHSKGTYAAWFHFADEKLDALLDEGRVSTDEALRNEIYHDVEARTLEILPWSYLIRRTQGEAMAAKVKGYTHLPSWNQITLREVWLED